MVIEYGPEIMVNGQRPSWLTDDDRPWVRSNQDGEWERFADWHPSHYNWERIGALRLPVGHPQYAALPTDPSQE